MTTPVQVPERVAIPQEERWNAESVFSTVEAWQTEYNAVKADLPQLATYKGKLSSSPDTLADYWESASMLRRRVSKLYFYGAMENAVDSASVDAKMLVGQVISLYGEYSQAVAFENPELIAMGEGKLRDWVSKESRLKMYAMLVDDLFRQQKFVRSSEVEEVLGMIDEPFGTASQTAGELTNTDLRFPDAVGSDGSTMSVTQSSIGMALGSTDREIRRSAWTQYMDQHLAFKNTLATAYVTSVKQNTMMMRVRNYDSVLHMILSPNNIPTSVFHTLIDTYKKNLPTWHRYWDVRRRALGLDSIHPYDIWAPLTTNEPKVSFEQAVNWIADGLSPLGNEYTGALKKGCLEDRWVDRAVNKGKRQGAFSGGTYDTYPFIMMSFDNGLGGMSTLAHELGHSLHSYLSRKNQPEVYAGYSLFAAEVASNFNQAMTRAHLFKTQTDRNFQMTLIQEAMDNFHRYFFIMPTLARFELEVHERNAAGKPLTAEILNGIMSDLFAEGYGTTMGDDRERTGITWATFGHLYRAYYTFQYATGISAAHALADRVQNGGESAAQDYLKFLSAGGSIYPLDALKLAGVDMNSPEPVEKAFAVLSGLVDRLESLIS